MSAARASPPEGGARRGGVEEGGAPLTVGECPRFLAAADKFVTENSGFESSAVGEAVRRDLEKATSLYQASLVPLRHKVFGFETALKWGFFVHTAGGRLFGEEAAEDGPLSPSFRDPALWPPFDAGKFFGELAAIYDLAVESSVWEHCNSDSDSDDDDDDDEDDEDDAAVEEPAEGPRGEKRRDREAPRPRSG